MMSKIQNWLQKRFANWLTKDVFNLITEDDILQVKGKRLWCAGKLVDTNETEILKQQARSILASRLWKFLKKDIEYQACLRMFRKGLTTEDMVAGKIAIDIIDKIEKRLKELAKL